MNELAMLAQSSVTSWASVALAGAVNLVVIALAAGKIIASLNAVERAQDAARTESKAQHEETRREIASLREDRVKAATEAEHMRGDIEALKTAQRDLRAHIDEVDKRQSDARHDQTNTIATTLRQMVDLALSEAATKRGDRTARRG